jgi:hypothetical protein
MIKISVQGKDYPYITDSFSIQDNIYIFETCDFNKNIQVHELNKSSVVEVITEAGISMKDYWDMVMSKSNKEE